MPTKKNHTPAEQAQQRLADALALEEQRATEHTAAVEAVEDLDARLDSGDDTVSEDDMLRAAVRVQRASKLLAAAQSDVAAARRALVNTDDSLAVALAGPLGEALAVAVIPTCAGPTEVPTKLPRAVLVQSSPSTPNLRTGALSGEVVLTYFGAEHLHLLPTKEGVRSALSAVGVHAEVHPAGGLRHGEDVRSVSLRLTKVADAYPAVPVIGSAPGPDTLKSASYLCQDAVEGAFELTASPTAGLPRAAHTATPTRDERLPVLVMTEDRRVVSATTAKDGTRQTTVEVRSTARPTSWTRLTGTDVYDALPEVTAAMVGKVGAGLGRVTSAAVVSTDAPEKGRGLHITFRLVFASRLPEGQTEPTPVVPPQPSTPQGGRGTAGVESDYHGRPVGSHPGLAAAR